MRHILIACAALVPAWSAASAQESDDLRIRVGLGAQVRPDFIGADGTEVAPLWRVNVARGTNEFKFSAPDYSFGIPLVSSGAKVRRVRSSRASVRTWSCWMQIPLPISATSPGSTDSQ